MSEEDNQTIPTQIHKATMLLWASLAVGLLIGLIDSNTALKSASIFFVVSGVAIIMLLEIWLIYKIRKGRNWARITCLVLFIFVRVPYVPELLLMFDRSVIVGGLSSAHVIMEVVGLYLVFSKPGSLWFKNASKPDVL